MYFRRRFAVKYMVAAVCGAAIYNEWLLYVMQPWYWDKLECPHHDANCTRVLFIADPQIQGDLAVSPPLSYLYNWDSDRYLRSTFSIVVHHFKPDVLVYLGDLMDEGSISTKVQFHKYVKRLLHIFEVQYTVTQVFIPGDNDIGGENEPVKADKVKEFNKVFQGEDIISFRNVRFYKVNKITRTKPNIGVNGSDHLRVIVSHYSVTENRQFDRQVYDEIHPHIYFSAHDHVSKYMRISSDFLHRNIYQLRYGDGVLKISLDGMELKKEVYEILVPTSSYRMGTENIGYGAAVFDNKNRSIHYTVFWSPKRFLQLYCYLVLVILFTAYFVMFSLAKIIFAIKKNMARGQIDRLSLIES